MAPIVMPFDFLVEEDEVGGEFEAAKEGHATGVGMGTVAGHVTATEQGHKRARVEEPDEAPQVP
jgi:hypothetical protein